MVSVTLREEDLNVMFDHAVREYPDECCGIIIGEQGTAVRNEVRPCANIQRQLKQKYPHLYQRDADTGYFVDPKEMMAVFDDAAKRKLDIVGFYHSHPNHEPYWSEEDHRAAMWAGAGEPSYPSAFHVVVSIYGGVVKSAAAYVWDEANKVFARKDIARGGRG